MSQAQTLFRFSLRRLFAVIVVVAAVGAIYVATIGRSPMSRLFGGSENMAIVREATRVEATRLAPPEGVDPFLGETLPLEYRTVGSPVVVESKLAQSLQTTLLSSETYMWDAAKACGYPVYGVKLSFFRGSERVDVYFCFGCMVLAVVRDRTVYMPEDFDYGERVFVETVKSLFPDDAEIQAIRQ